MRVPYVKRVVAIAGDSVEFTGSQFLRNNIPQSEPYIAPNHNYDDLSLVVPAGSVFVAGDNREHSLDSRQFGPLPTSSIIGKVCKY
jgi:signal peptidase I